MPHVFHQLDYHFAWATHAREPLIDRRWQVNRDLKPKFKLRWQEGYGVLTLRKDEVESVSRYIDNQEEHHRTGRLSALLEMTETAEDDWPEGLPELEAP